MEGEKPIEDLEQSRNTSRPHFIALHFLVLQTYYFFFFFNKLKVCGNSAWNKLIGAIFPCFFSLVSDGFY